jgi:hypothetical protein
MAITAYNDYKCAPRVGFEPTAARLTVECTADCAT